MAQNWTGRSQCSNCKLIVQKLPSIATVSKTDRAAHVIPHQFYGTKDPCHGQFYRLNRQDNKRKAGSLYSDDGSTTGSETSIERPKHDYLATRDRTLSSTKAMTSADTPERQSHQDDSEKGFYADRPAWCYLHHHSRYHAIDCEVDKVDDTIDNLSFSARGTTVFTDDDTLQPIGDIDGLTPEIDLLRATFEWSKRELCDYKTFVTVRDLGIEKVCGHLNNNTDIDVKLIANIEYLFDKANRATEALIKYLTFNVLENDCVKKPFQRLCQAPPFKDVPDNDDDQALETMIAKLVAGPGPEEDWKQPLVPAESMRLLKQKIMQASYKYWAAKGEIVGYIARLTEGENEIQTNSLANDSLELVMHTLLQHDASKTMGCWSFPDLEQNWTVFTAKHHIDILSN